MLSDYCTTQFFDDAEFVKYIEKCANFLTGVKNNPLIRKGVPDRSQETRSIGVLV